jgi:chromosome segregation ATPase
MGYAMLNDTKVLEAKSLIETTDTRLDELTKVFDEARKDIAVCAEKIKNNNEDTEKQTRQMRILNMKCEEIKAEHSPLVHLVREQTELLAKDEFDKKVQKVVDEATPFYTALETRLNRLQAEYKETMSDLFHFVEPDVVIGFIKKRIEGFNDFSQITLNYRNAKANYEARLKRLGTAKVKGDKPSFEDAKQQLLRLDGFLESEDVIHLWHRQL